MDGFGGPQPTFSLPDSPERACKIMRNVWVETWRKVTLDVLFQPNFHPKHVAMFSGSCFTLELRMGILVTQRVFTGTLLVWIDGWGIEPQNLWTPNAEGTPQNPNQREAEKRCR